MQKYMEKNAKEKTKKNGIILYEEESSVGLKEEIANKRSEIIVDSYPMSIGEIMNIYKDGELDVHPEFQRFFRWDTEQKTKLIESILLGIPIPPIFVAQKLNGKWDVIDGQQRLSTILQFLQVLKKDSGEKYDPLILSKTKFIPSLSGVRWDNNELFSEEQKITFKREKLSFTIIKESTDNDNSKYEMFQRLNTGGTHLSPQELRNCLLIMINRPLYQILLEMSELASFKKSFSLTETKTEERYDLELVVRYLLYICFTDDFLNDIDKGRNMDTFLTEELEKIAISNDSLDRANKENFANVFDLLQKCLGDDVFKRYKDNKFTGGTLLSSFEAIVPGVYKNIDYWQNNIELLNERIKQLYSNEDYEFAMRKGIRALDRMSQLIKFSRVWFSHEN